MLYINPLCKQTNICQKLLAILLLIFIIIKYHLPRRYWSFWLCFRGARGLYWQYNWIIPKIFCKNIYFPFSHFYSGVSSFTLSKIWFIRFGLHLMIQQFICHLFSGDRFTFEFNAIRRFSSSIFALCRLTCFAFWIWFIESNLSSIRFSFTEFANFLLLLFVWQCFYRWHLKSVQKFFLRIKSTQCDTVE